MVVLLKRKMIHIEWLMQTKLLLILDREHIF
jgi:hypothetical protein